LKLNFEHNQSAHCENGVVSNLLNYNGLRVSEPMVFGIASGVFFIFLPFVKVNYAPMFSFRPVPGFIFSRVSKRLGFKIKRIKFRSKEKARQSLDQELKNKFGLTKEQLVSLDAEYLINLIETMETDTAVALVRLAGWIDAQGTVYEAQKLETESYHTRLQELMLRMEAALGKELSNAHLDGRIDTLVAMMNAYVLPEKTMLKLMEYYEKTTRFDKAENILFELLEEYITEANMVQHGLKFYERLMNANVTELAAGNLSREEVQEGFDELWEKQ